MGSGERRAAGGLGAWLRARQKCLGAVLGTALFALQAAISDGHVTGGEAGGIITGLAVSVVVYVLPNVQPEDTAAAA